jgi:hypothetical protein
VRVVPPEILSMLPQQHHRNTDWATSPISFASLFYLCKEPPGPFPLHTSPFRTCCSSRLDETSLRAYLTALKDEYLKGVSELRTETPAQ